MVRFWFASEPGHVWKEKQKDIQTSIAYITMCVRAALWVWWRLPETLKSVPSAVFFEAPFPISLCSHRSDRGGVRCSRGVGVQVRTRTKFSHCLQCFSCVSRFGAFPETLSAHLRHLLIIAPVFRSRAVVSVEAAMILTPKILNPDDRQCLLPQTDVMVTW